MRTKLTILITATMFVAIMLLNGCGNKPDFSKQPYLEPVYKQMQAFNDKDFATYWDTAWIFMESSMPQTREEYIETMNTVNGDAKGEIKELNDVRHIEKEDWEDYLDLYTLKSSGVLEISDIEDVYAVSTTEEHTGTGSLDGTHYVTYTVCKVNGEWAIAYFVMDEQ